MTEVAMAKGLSKAELQLANDALTIANHRMHTVLVELAMGFKPEHTEVSPSFGADNGGQVTLTLWRSNSASGGLVMMVRRDADQCPDVQINSIDTMCYAQRQECLHTDCDSQYYMARSWMLGALERMASISHAITRGTLGVAFGAQFARRCL